VNVQVMGELTGPHWEMTFREQVDEGQHRPSSGVRGLTVGG